MKTFMKITFIFIFCLIGTSFIHAGMNGTDKKIIEIKKIINLTEEQENKIRSLHVIYTRVADSALIYSSTRRFSPGNTDPVPAAADGCFPWCPS